ncbi:zinc metalloprotease HtpX [Furfurilactobacillus sp. WILCCON 0119]
MLYEQIRQNKRRTVYVLIGFILLTLAVGAALGYAIIGSTIAGLLMAAVITAFYCFLMISNSTNVVMRMNHAREITSADQAPELWHIVEDMALVARVPMPKVFIIDDDSPNAFATGNDPEHAAVAATTGILAVLNREELEGVIGHEMSHVRNYDIRLQTIALALAAAISMLASIGARSLFWGGGRRRSNDNNSNNDYLQIILLVVSLVLIVLAPIAASIAQMALSRNREYLADAGAVELTRNPHGLISALQKISAGEPMTEADPSSAALYISDPLKKRSMAHLFDTHPPMADRIARLEKM